MRYIKYATIRNQSNFAYSGIQSNSSSTALKPRFFFRKARWLVTSPLDNKSFSIATATFRSNLFSRIVVRLLLATRCYVRLELKENDPCIVLVNINSLMKRLPLSKEQKASAIKTGTLMQQTIDAHVYDQSIAEKYTISANGTLQTKKDQIDTGITAQQLKKIIQIAEKTKVGETTLISGLEELGTLEEKKAVYAYRKGNNELYLLPKHSFTKIGSGATATVSSVVDLVRGKTLAFKEAKSFADFIKKTKQLEQDSVKTILHETTILNILHDNENEPTEGIQAPPLAIFQFSSNKAPLMGYLVEKYDNDAVSFFLDNQKQLPIALKLEACRQLLVGFKHLQEKGIYHGDIKLENILVRQKEDGRYEFHLADFGEAMKYEDIKPFVIDPKSAFFPFPSGYTPTSVAVQHFMELSEKLEAMKSTSTDNNNQDDKQVYQELLKKHELFALGVALFEIVTSKPKQDKQKPDRQFPYPINFLQYLATEKGFNEKALADAAIGEDLKNLIRQMTAVENGETSTTTPFSIDEALKKIISIIDTTHAGQEKISIV